MSRTRTRTASLLAVTALLLGASPAMAATRNAGPPAGSTHPAPHVHVTGGTPAVLPTRIRLVTMPG